MATTGGTFRDVAGDGQAHNLRRHEAGAHGQLRRRHHLRQHRHDLAAEDRADGAGGVLARSRSPPQADQERAEPLAAGEIARIDVAVRQHATRFLKGDILQLDLRGNWHFPRDPLFGQFLAFYAPSSKGNWVLLSGGEYDSHLLLGSRAISVTAAQVTRHG
jgi:predicted acyl esterase